MVTTGSALEGEAAQAIPPMHAKRTPVRCLALSADHDLGGIKSEEVKWAWFQRECTRESLLSSRPMVA